MSMALILEFTQEWLRAKNGWAVNQCGVQYDSLPALDAGQFYVSIDESSLEAGSDLTDSLKEMFFITIGVWRRAEHLSIKDKRGHLKLPTDRYLISAYSLYDLERLVILPKNNGLHANYQFLYELNKRYNLPSADYGPSFIRPLFYQGRGKMDVLTIEADNKSPQAWYGYKLRFKGLEREQKLRGAFDAQG
jgi:hypothetical protein